MLELWQLRQRQGLPLNIKVRLTLRRIEDFYKYYNGEIYISFSGGKDSTVLLHLVRSLYPDIKAVFCDTGLEYPEVREFVKTFENVDIIRPEVPFNKVLDKYGYPVISKQVATTLRKLRTQNLSKKFRDKLLYGDERGTAGKLPEKWKFLLKAPFKISEQCCDVMKKRPFAKFEKKSGLHPLIGTMASDSRNREIAYLKSGCNSFDKGRSQPMSFWNTEDVWNYIKQENLPYAKVYDMGSKNTGCIFCMFGIQYDECNNRFQCMAKTHPQLYSYCMDKLGIREVLEFMNIPCDGFQESLPPTVKQEGGAIPPKDKSLGILANFL